MFERNSDEKVIITSLIESLKTENERRKKILASREYKLGSSFLKLKASLKNDGINFFFNFIKMKKKFKKGSSFSMAEPLAHYEKTESNFFSNDKIAVYTCIIGKYDSLLEPLFVPDNCDFYAITSFEIPSTSVWKRIDPNDFLISKELNSSVMLNRYFKMHPDIVFPDYKCSIYVDGNIRICTDLTEYANRIPGSIGLAFFRHSQRMCVYEEGAACLAMGKASRNHVEEQLKFLKSEGFPQKYGLPTCCVIARYQNMEKCRLIMNEWWKLFYKYPYRDQLSISYALYRCGVSVDSVTLLGKNVYEDPSFEFVQHC